MLFVTDVVFGVFICCSFDGFFLWRFGRGCDDVIDGHCLSVCVRRLLSGSSGFTGLYRVYRVFLSVPQTIASSKRPTGTTENRTELPSFLDCFNRIFHWGPLLCSADLPASRKAAMPERNAVALVSRQRHHLFRWAEGHR